MAGNKRNQTSPVGSPTSGNISDSSSSKEQDRFLPIANVSRIMKRALPANAKISKEAKETVQECVSEFISFITGEASDKCQREKRKTINGDDLLWAMTTLGFENYVGPLKVYLNNYRETEGEKSNNNSSSSMVTSTKQDDYDLNNSSIEVNHDVVVGGFYSQVINGGRVDETEHAIGSGNRIMPPNLRYRVEW
ncbi:nuclear transcription factor Y subunit B-3 [Trifolium repens]|nr:nuclear transcription factor Y subunit B-3 [Trifolium repens]